MFSFNKQTISAGEAKLKNIKAFQQELHRLAQEKKEKQRKAEEEKKREERRAQDMTRNERLNKRLTAELSDDLVRKIFSMNTVVAFEQKSPMPQKEKQAAMVHLKQNNKPENDEIKTEIGLPLSLKEQAQLMPVSKTFNVLFKPVFTLNVLHQAVVEGNLERVKHMIAKQPELLLKKGTAIDFSGRKIIGTALQMAWGAEDPEMIDAIQRALLTLPNGKAIIQAQYAEQFPAGWQEKEEKEWAPIIKAMRDAFLAVEQANNNDVTYANKKFTIHSEDLKTAVDRFRTLLAELMKKTITIGRHFNSALWLEAAMICDDDAAWQRRGGWSDRNILANCQLYGFIQRYLPSRSAMATAQGLAYITEDGEELKRSFKFRYEPIVSIYPLNSDSGWVLGENYYAGGAGGRGAERGLLAGLAWRVGQNFCRSTTADLQILRDLGQLNPKTLNRSALL